jgi:endonuclease YncB( thermonuclease family)
MRKWGPKPLEYLARRRRRRIAVTVACVLMLAGLTWLDRAGLLLHRLDDVQRYEGKTFHVAFVIDGDTLDIAAPDPPRKTTRIRLWGVNAPEVAHPQYNDKPDEPFGPEAATFVHQLCDGRDVQLHLQPHRLRDRSDVRVLAYVTLPDGTSLNERLLAAGLAKADDRWPHEQSERYAMLDKQAQHDRIGVWSLTPKVKPTRSKAKPTPAAVSQPSSATAPAPDGWEAPGEGEANAETE